MFDKTAAFQYGNQVSELLEIAENGGAEKTSMEHEFSNVVRAFIRENSFCEKILPPQEVTADDREMQISTTTKNETFEYIVFLEPDASAQVYSATGTADSMYITADRIAIPIGTVSSNKFEKHEDELEIYRGVGLIKMVEQNAAKEVGDYQDEAFMELSRKAVQGNGLDLDSGGIGITKSNFIDLINAPLQNHMRVKNILMTETTFNNFFKQGSDVFGLTLQSEIIVEGYKEDKILKVPVTTTIKNYIVNDNEIFAYPSPDFLGKFLVMGALKFRIKKNDGIVSWQCYKKWGLAFINENGVARLKINGFVD